MWSLVLATLLTVAAAQNDPPTWCRAAIISNGSSAAEFFWNDTATWANAAIPKPGTRVLDKNIVGASVIQVVLKDTNANVGSMNLKSTVVKLSASRRLVLSGDQCSSPKRRRAQCSTDLLLLKYLRVIASEDGNFEVECDFGLVIRDGGDTSRRNISCSQDGSWSQLPLCVVSPTTTAAPAPTSPSRFSSRSSTSTKSTTASRSLSSTSASASASPQPSTTPKPPKLLQSTANPTSYAATSNQTANGGSDTAISSGTGSLTAMVVGIVLGVAVCIILLVVVAIAAVCGLKNRSKDVLLIVPVFNVTYPDPPAADMPHVPSRADWGREVRLSPDLLQIYNQQDAITVHPRTSYQPSSERILRTSNYKLIYEQIQVRPTDYSVVTLSASVKQIISFWAERRQLPCNQAIKFHRSMEKQMLEGDALVQDLGTAAQLVWTSANKLDGTEFCTMVNDLIRRDEPEAIIHVVMFARMINTMLVAQRSNVAGNIQDRGSSRFPPKGTTWRGTGFDDTYKPFFDQHMSSGAPFRIPAFLATSFKKSTAEFFMGFQPAGRQTVLWRILVDPQGRNNPNRRCQHVAFVAQTRVQGEQEYLFTPYSVFKVRRVMWSTALVAGMMPHEIVLTAEPNNKAHSEELLLAPWH